MRVRVCWFENASYKVAAAVVARVALAEGAIDALENVKGVGVSVRGGVGVRVRVGNGQPNPNSHPSAAR